MPEPIDYRELTQQDAEDWRLIIDTGERRVFWNLSPDHGVAVLQSFVQGLGPADGEEDR